ncbi:MAG: SGNH/GDSL hydrolase family protein [Pseudomonadota bacterium]
MASTTGPIAFFGDSLTDDGNLPAFGELILEPGAIDGLGGPTGAASDGVTFATYTTDLLGAELQSYSVTSAEVDGVQDLAFVAENFGLTEFLTVEEDDPLLEIDINLNGQVDRYLADTAGQDLSHTTAFILIGSNDYAEVDLTSETLIADILDKIDAVISGIKAQAYRLDAAGVGTIRIATIPSADFFAATALLEETDALLADAVFVINNLLLEATVRQLNRDGVNAELFDTRQITDTLTEDPTAFGFISPVGTRLTEEGALDEFDADQILAFDFLHPTTAAHGVIGAFSAFELAGGETAVMSSDRTDLYRGSAADEFVSGLAETDFMRLGDGDDIGIGGTGNDDIDGQKGNDLLMGGSDDDLLRGNGGNDILGGGEGNDVLLGGGGRDLLIDGLGSDVGEGGKGNDTFVYTQADLIGGTQGDIDVFDGGLGNDRLIVVLDSDNFDALSGDLEGGAADTALATLGITATDIETVVAVEGRDGLDAFAHLEQFQTADVWGLI